MTRFHALILCAALGAGVPAAAETVPSNAAPPLVQHEQKPSSTNIPDAEGEVVVTASTEAKSSWNRAEAAHVVVLSNGSEAELIRVTKRLEQLHRLMTRIYRAGDTTDVTVKPEIILPDSDRAIQAIPPDDLRSQEGPYAAGFTVARYYDPREDGELLVVPRVDQKIRLDTERRFHSDCDDFLRDGGEGSCIASAVIHPPLTRPWETTLYSLFAQRFVLTYLPAAYPRWYLDGVGALFSTIAGRKDEALDYARAPDGYGDIFKSYGDPKPADILTGRYLTAADVPWTPYHAWLIAHFFLFADEGRRYEGQLARYLQAIQQGKTPAEAARAFDNLPRLQRDLIAQLARPVSYARTAPMPTLPDEEPLVTNLRPSSVALVDAQIALRSQPEGGDSTAAIPDWLARARGTALRFPDDPDVLTFAAEAECRSGRAEDCLTAANRVLTKTPDDTRALAWKGIALTDRALVAAPADRGATLVAAREVLQRAVAKDPSPLPAIAYFQSFTRAGERAPEPAMAGMAKAIQAVPAAPAPRLYLAQELLRQGNTDLARRVLHPVLDGPYDSPERRAAERLFPTGGARASTQHANAAGG